MYVRLFQKYRTEVRNSRNIQDYRTLSIKTGQLQEYRTSGRSAESAITINWSVSLLLRFKPWIAYNTGTTRTTLVSYGPYLSSPRTTRVQQAALATNTNKITTEACMLQYKALKNTGLRFFYNARNFPQQLFKSYDVRHTTLFIRRYSYDVNTTL